MKLHAGLIWATRLVSARELWDALSSVPELSVFQEYLDLFGVDPYEHSIASNAPITVLAPSNDGYAEATAMGLGLADGCPMHAQRMLQYGILDHDFREDGNATIAFSAMKGRNTTSHSPVKLFSDGQDKYVESGLGIPIKVISDAIAFDEGNIYVIESPLVVPHDLFATLQSNGMRAFVDALDSHGLASTFESLHDATLFVPATALEGDICPMTLLNHALLGEVVFSDSLEAEEERMYRTMAGQEIKVTKMPCGCLIVNGQHVVKQDVIWAGGVLHVLEDVLLPASGLRPTPTLRFRTSLLSRLFGGAASVLEAACLAALAMSLVALVQLYRNIRQLEKVLHERSTARLGANEGEKDALLYHDYDTQQENPFEA